MDIGNEKEYELKKWIMEKEIDVCGLQEIGINWRNCRGKGSIRERMKYHGWEYSRMVSSYNKNCEIGRHQYGGTMTFMKDQITHRVSASGIDEIGLGSSHDGIIILSSETRTGTLASNYFDVINDFMMY